MRVLTGLVLLLFLSIPVFADYLDTYPYESKYDRMYASMTDIDIITNSLDDKENDVVFCALKRVGQLRLTNAAEKVRSLVASGNPAANQGKAMQTANFKSIFHMSIMVLGKIGTTNDGAILGSYLRDVKDPIGIVCLLQAMGDLNTSGAALDAINEFTLNIRIGEDKRIIRQLLEAIRNHNSRSSIGPLLRLQKRVDADDAETVNELIKRLNKTGKARTKK